MNDIFSFLLLISIPIALYFIKKKIKDTLWFLKIRYVFRILFKSIILLGLAYAFVSTAFAYLTYSKYTATVDGYHEFNTTSDEGVERTMYNVVYSFQVGETNLSITDKTSSSSSKPTIGKHSEVLYGDGELMVYNPIMFLIVSLIGMGVFYFVVDLIKTDYVRKPLMPKDSFWANTSRSHEFSISLNSDSDEEDRDKKEHEA